MLFKINQKLAVFQAKTALFPMGRSSLAANFGYFPIAYKCWAPLKWILLWLLVELANTRSPRVFSATISSSLSGRMAKVVPFPGGFTPS